MGQAETFVPLADHRSLVESIANNPYFYRILGQIVEQIRQLVRIEQCGLILYDPRTNEMRLQRPAIGYSEHIFDIFHIPVDAKSITTTVFHSGKAHLSEDVDKDPLVSVPLQKAIKAKNSLFVPLELDGERIGVFHLANKAGGFNEHDLSLATLLSYHLSILLENMRLLETNTRLLDTERNTVAELTAANEELASANEEIDAQRDLLRRTLSIHDDLTRMVLDNEGLEAICGTLSRLLASHVSLVDRFGRLMSASAPDDGTAADEAWQKAIEDGGIPEPVRTHPKVREVMALLQRDRRPTRLPPISEIGFRHPRVVAPVVVGQEVMAFVTVLESTRSLDEHDIIALERAGTAIALHVMKERAAAAAQYKLVADFVGELISGTFGARDLAMRRAGYLGIDLQVPRVVMIVEVSERDHHDSNHDEDTVIATRERVLEVIGRLCNGSQIGAVVCQRSDEVIILAQVSEVGPSARRALHRLGDTIREQMRLWLPEMSLIVGIGGHCASPEAYADSYQKARRAIDFTRSLRQTDRTVSFDQLSVFGKLFAAQARETLAPLAYETLGRLIEYDRAHGTALVATLDQYLMHDGRLEATAGAMFLHRSTMSYRLGRIEELLAVDLHDVDTKLNLQLALKALRAVES